MKISAFESSFWTKRKPNRLPQLGGGMLLFLFYCGWVSEKISFRKACNASETCKASERTYKVTGMACMRRTGWNQFLKVKKAVINSIGNIKGNCKGFCRFPFAVAFICQQSTVNSSFSLIILSHRSRLFPYKFVTGNRFAFIILS